MIVTLDGPAGSGKSSVARQLAERLEFDFLDTGAMYRAVAVCSADRKLAWDNEPAIGKLAGSLQMVFEADRLLVNGEDLTDRLRNLEITTAASRVAVIPLVREALVKLQREAARGKNMVTEGRDQGTVVFPAAECKFYVTADPEERARRRLRELRRKAIGWSWPNCFSKFSKEMRGMLREKSPPSNPPSMQKSSTPLR